LELVGNTWYYRRVVPLDAREAFGKSVVRISLHTSSLTEAKRLEKQHDVDFEIRLQAARASGPDGYPNRAERIKRLSDAIFKETESWQEEKHRWPRAREYLTMWFGEGASVNLESDTIPPEFPKDLVKQLKWKRKLAASVPEAERWDVETALLSLDGDAESMLYTLDEFWANNLRELLFLLFWDAREAWQEVERELVEVVKRYCESRSDPTIELAYEQWLKAKYRPQQTQDEARRYIEDFKKFTHLRTLSSIRRRHLTDWRDKLREAGDLAPKSINHRLEIVSAILRTGWREAEIATPPDLGRVNVPELVSNGRKSWSRDELLGALAALEPRSWSAWVFVVALTTGTRIGEPIAAVKEWYDFATGCIKVPAEFTKMKKKHALPIIELIREPLVEHISTLPAGAYMFNAPRPANAKLKISHEASKWYSRFFDRHKIVDRVFHELRDTWIETARESEVKKDIFEIITGHSPKTGSDPYGGEKPHVLMAANEEVCRQLLDPEMTVAVRRLVG
jgi:integrase